MPLSELARILTRAPYAIIKSASGKPVVVQSADLTAFFQTGKSAGPASKAAKQAAVAPVTGGPIPLE